MFWRLVAAQQHHPKQHCEILVARISHKKYNNLFKIWCRVVLGKRETTTNTSCGNQLLTTNISSGKQWKKLFGAFQGSSTGIRFLQNCCLHCQVHLTTAATFYPKMSVMVQHLAKSWYNLSHQAQTAIYLHKRADRGFQEKFTRQGEKKNNKKARDWVIDLNTKKSVRYALTDFTSEIVNVKSWREGFLSVTKQGNRHFKWPNKRRKQYNQINMQRVTIKMYKYHVLYLYSEELNGIDDQLYIQ